MYKNDFHCPSPSIPLIIQWIRSQGIVLTAISRSDAINFNQDIWFIDFERCSDSHCFVPTPFLHLSHNLSSYCSLPVWTSFFSLFSSGHFYIDINLFPIVIIYVIMVSFQEHRPTRQSLFAKGLLNVALTLSSEDVTFFSVLR